MKLISVKVTKRQLAGLDELLRREKYPTRSEAIRIALRDLIRRKYGRY
ncbi:MAG: ribbon-helix-helix protein, CopG family [Candidatus Heimdallarchaeota archaeon]|nr:ribbon-helix-helix protein, CopG family [Candidatus Heimdallarchaeota archaeon]